MIKKKLNPRQERFCDLYVLYLNATKAYQETYNVDNAESARVCACKLLMKANVRDRIDELRQNIANRYDSNLDKVIGELNRIGFSNMDDYLRKSVSGEPVIDFSRITRDQAAAIQSFSVTEKTDEEGDVTRTVRFSLYDKKAALVDLGKHYGGFKTNVKVEADSLEKLLLATQNQKQEDTKGE